VKKKTCGEDLTSATFKEGWSAGGGGGGGGSDPELCIKGAS